MGGKCGKCAGLNMQVGRLKKQLEQGDRKEIPNMRPYISKLDVMLNLAENIGDSKLVDNIKSEINNFKTMLELLIRDLEKPSDAREGA